MKKNILFITDYIGMSPFIGSLSKHLSDRGINVDILDTNKWVLYKNGEVTKRLLSPKKIKYFNRYLNLIKLYLSIKKLEHYDSINIFYFQYWVGKLIKCIKRKTENISIAYAGSDFYRVSDEKKNKVVKILNKCDTIIFNNSQMLEDFNKFYGNRVFTKKKITGLGIDILQLISKNNTFDKQKQFKEKYKIPLNKIILTIGYNANPAQQHINILKNLKKIDNKKNVFIILPLTYGGNDNYVKEVEKQVKQLNIGYKIFNDYLSDNDVSLMRIVSDITVNMQVSDQASHALLEHLAAGNILLVADWLPYKFWDEMGIFYHKTNWNNLLFNLNKIIENYIEEKRMCEDNKRLVFDNWTWEKRSLLWREALNV